MDIGGASNGGGAGSSGPIKLNQFHKMREPLTPAQQDEKLKNVSSMYEKQFLRHMLSAMRGTVTEGGFMPANNAEKIFRGQLDEEYVDKWGDKGGIGLADMIHKQLLERLGPALGITQMPEKPTGPIQINERSLQKNPLILHSDPNRPQKITMELDLQKATLDAVSKEENKSEEDGPSEVQAPWAGKLLGSKKLSPDEYLLEMLHDNGLKSQMVFRGSLEKELQPAQMQAGQRIEAGQRLGMLSPEAKSFFWTVDGSAAKKVE